MLTKENLHNLFGSLLLKVKETESGLGLTIFENFTLL
ncbi:hypothetical protein X474_16245 [Dethiosulfatarculus sandiegensis]|uniref:Uncharacterized protein n=1 Tax=Dethiosulfatarculus sandiegensis TaxID=1429043 RepID=A0A0D2GDH4_9BACT|nr:hypothetical protein X474_16245 [Dethiosulfatarculus sandiegensis]